MNDQEQLERIDRYLDALNVDPGTPPIGDLMTAAWRVHRLTAGAGTPPAFPRHLREEALTVGARRAFLRRRVRWIELGAAAIVLFCLVAVSLIFRNGKPAPGMVGSAVAADPKVQAIVDQVPFDLVLPNYLPPKWTLVQVEAEPEPVGERTFVHLRFTGPQGFLDVTESTFQTQLGGESEQIAMGDTTGYYAEHLSPEGTVRTALFSAGDVSVTLTSIGLTKDELLDIARSMGP